MSTISIVAMTPVELHFTISRSETLFAGFVKFESADAAEAFKEAVSELAGSPFAMSFSRHADYRKPVKARVAKLKDPSR